MIEDILTGRFWKRKRAKEAANQLALNLQSLSTDGKVEVRMFDRITSNDVTTVFLTQQTRTTETSASSDSDSNQRPGTSGKRSQGRGSRRRRKRKNSGKSLDSKNGLLKQMQESPYDGGLKALMIPNVSGMSNPSAVPSNSSVPGTSNTPRTSFYHVTRPEAQEEQPMDLRKSTVFEGSVAKSGSPPASLSRVPILNGMNQ